MTSNTDNTIVTTGMSDEMICKFDPYKPRILQKKSAMISNDYGIIPDLRSPRKRNVLKSTF
jgi:hypothetical protein